MIEGILALLAIIVGLFIKGSFQANRIDDLEEENHAAKKTIKIKSNMRKAEKEAKANEAKKKANINDDDWYDDI